MEMMQSVALSAANLHRTPGHAPAVTGPCCLRAVECTMWCQTCGTEYCIRCSGKHFGHEVKPVDPFLARTTSVPKDAHQDDDQAGLALAAFRRTTSAAATGFFLARVTKKVELTSQHLQSNLRAMSSTMSKSAELQGEARRSMLAWFANVSPENLQSEIETAFRLYDTNGDGGLDVAEFSKAFKLMGKCLTVEEADILFKKYDVDGSGEIDLDEFSEMVHDILSQGCKENLYTGFGSDAAERTSAKVQRKQAASTLQSWCKNLQKARALNATAARLKADAAAAAMARNAAQLARMNTQGGANFLASMSGQERKLLAADLRDGEREAYAAAMLALLARIGSEQRQAFLEGMEAHECAALSHGTHSREHLRQQLYDLLDTLCPALLLKFLVAMPEEQRAEYLHRMSEAQMAALLAHLSTLTDAERTAFIGTLSAAETDLLTQSHRAAQRRPNLLASTARVSHVTRTLLLRKSPLFASISVADLRAVAHASSLKKLEKGNDLIREGAVPSALYTIVQGKLSVHVTNKGPPSGDGPRDNMIQVGEVSAGGMVGEHGMLTGSSATATCRAKTDVTILEITKPTLRRLMRDSPTLRKYLERFKAERSAMTAAKLRAADCTDDVVAVSESESLLPVLNSKKAQLLQALAFAPSVETGKETQEAAMRDRERAAAIFKHKASARVHLAKLQQERGPVGSGDGDGGGGEGGGGSGDGGWQDGTDLLVTDEDSSADSVDLMAAFFSRANSSSGEDFGVRGWRGAAVLEEVGRRLAQLFSGLSGEQLQDGIVDAFNQIDADSGGTLDKDEFKEAFQLITGKRLTDKELNIVFKEYDTDSSGEIDLGEFTHMMMVFLKKPCAEGCSSCTYPGHCNQPHIVYQARWADSEEIHVPAATALQARMAAAFARTRYAMMKWHLPQHDQLRGGRGELWSPSNWGVGARDAASVQGRFALDYCAPLAGHDEGEVEKGMKEEVAVLMRERESAAMRMEKERGEEEERQREEHLVRKQLQKLHELIPTLTFQGWQYEVEEAESCLLKPRHSNAPIVLEHALQRFDKKLNAIQLHQQITSGSKVDPKLLRAAERRGGVDLHSVSTDAQRKRLDSKTRDKARFEKREMRKQELDPCQAPAGDLPSGMSQPRIQTQTLKQTQTQPRSESETKTDKREEGATISEARLREVQMNMGKGELQVVNALTGTTSTLSHTRSAERLRREVEMQRTTGVDSEIAAPMSSPLDVSIAMSEASAILHRTPSNGHSSSTRRRVRIHPHDTPDKLRSEVEFKKIMHIDSEVAQPMPRNVGVATGVSANAAESRGLANMVLSVDDALALLHRQQPSASCATLNASVDQPVVKETSCTSPPFSQQTAAVEERHSFSRAYSAGGVLCHAHDRDVGPDRTRRDEGGKNRGGDDEEFDRHDMLWGNQCPTKVIQQGGGLTNPGQLEQWHQGFRPGIRNTSESMRGARRWQRVNYLKEQHGPDAGADHKLTTAAAAKRHQMLRQSLGTVNLECSDAVLEVLGEGRHMSCTRAASVGDKTLLREVSRDWHHQSLPAIGRPTERRPIRYNWVSSAAKTSRPATNMTSAATSAMREAFHPAYPATHSASCQSITSLRQIRTSSLSPDQSEPSHPRRRPLVSAQAASRQQASSSGARLPSSTSRLPASAWLAADGKAALHADLK